MKIRSRGPKALVTVLGISILVLSAASAPAQADPTSPRTLHGSGSDTTRDVMQGIAENSGDLLASWDALPDTHSLITVKGDTFTRPNGSGGGLPTFRRSRGKDVNTSSWDQGRPVPLGEDTFDYARSSVGPGNNQNSAGQLVYVPLAYDAVTMATGPTSTINADLFTLAQLRTLYRDGMPVTAGGVTYQPRPGQPGHNITLLIPRLGSGTREYWATTMGFVSDAPPAWVFDSIGGTPNQDNDGSLVTANPRAISPFSVASWIAQGDSIPGVIDRRAGSDIHRIDGEEPYLIENGEEVLNTAFNVTRVVYNIVDHAEVTGNDLDVQDAFNGPNSVACTTEIGGRNAIEVYGFALLEDGVPTQLRCGDVFHHLRAFPNG